MRYYSIVIKDKNGKAPSLFPAVSGALVSGANFTSFINGKTDFGALNVEMDIPVGPSHIAGSSSAWVRVWGIGLQQIGQAANLNNMNIEVYGGMQAGLPLANPAQSGLLVKGTIFPAFGNWIGNDLTIDMLVSNVPSTGQPQVSNAANIVHNVPANQPLADPLKSTLTTAFPKFKPVIQISPKLVLPYADTGFYQSLQQYSLYLNGLTKSILGGTYPGVSLILQGSKIIATDGTSGQSAKGKIGYQDLIGQPTWLDNQTVQVKTVMRADLNIADIVTLPQSPQTLSAASQTQVRSNLSFQGKFQITEMRHVGNFRQPDGASWVTILNLTAQGAT